MLGTLFNHRYRIDAELGRGGVSGDHILTRECYAEGTAPYAPITQVIRNALTTIRSRHPHQAFDSIVPAVVIVAWLEGGEDRWQHGIEKAEQAVKLLRGTDWRSDSAPKLARKRSVQPANPG